MIRTLLAFLAFALAAPVSAQPAPIPSALAQAVAATQASKAAYAFDLHLVSADMNWRARYLPDATPRLQLLEPALETLARDQRRAFARMGERMEGVPWCASAEMAHVADVRLLREDAETATYSFQPTRESIRGEQARNYAEHLRGEFTLSKAEPDLTRVRIFAARAFSPIVLVNVERLSITISCATAPNGRHYAAETVSEVQGAAFGQAFNERTVQRTHSLRAAP
jgi:hypothetical protein